MHKSVIDTADINRVDKPATSIVNVDRMDNVSIGIADRNKKVEKPGTGSTDMDKTDNSGTKTKGVTRNDK